MKLKKPLPPNRSFEQVCNHYLVEKALADRLKKATREERKRMYATMYDDLFSQVPDHPRLTRRDDEQLTRLANNSKLALVRGLLNKSVVFAEFTPGDCRFAMEVAKHVKHVYAIDISDQRGRTYDGPKNFTLIVYDGYNLEQIQDESIDVIFSDQFIEHVHPEDARLHFELSYRILKHGGKYVFRTPHSFTGPHDISGCFSDEPEGFHLKEWTFIELKQLLTELRYSQSHAYRFVNGIKLRMPNVYSEICETMLKVFPKRYTRTLARYLVPSIYVVATK